MYRATDTGMVRDCLDRQKVDMWLPARRGRFVCRYSFIAFAEAKPPNHAFVHHRFILGSRDLCGELGSFLPDHNKDYGIPLSGSVIVELTGSESIPERRLKLRHQGTYSYPSRMKNPFIEAYEL